MSRPLHEKPPPSVVEQWVTWLGFHTLLFSFVDDPHPVTLACFLMIFLFSTWILQFLGGYPCPLYEGVNEYVAYSLDKLIISSSLLL